MLSQLSPSFCRKVYTTFDMHNPQCQRHTEYGMSLNLTFTFYGSTSNVQDTQVAKHDKVYESALSSSDGFNVIPHMAVHIESWRINIP